MIANRSHHWATRCANEMANIRRVSFCGKSLSQLSGEESGPRWTRTTYLRVIRAPRTVRNRPSVTAAHSIRARSVRRYPTSAAERRPNCSQTVVTFSVPVRQVAASERPADLAG
jgi:hypothetical protein